MFHSFIFINGWQDLFYLLQEESNSYTFLARKWLPKLQINIDIGFKTAKTAHTVKYSKRGGFAEPYNAAFSIWPYRETLINIFAIEQQPNKEFGCQLREAYGHFYCSFLGDKIKFLEMQNSIPMDLTNASTHATDIPIYRMYLSTYNFPSSHFSIEVSLRGMTALSCFFFNTDQLCLYQEFI